MLIWIIFAVLTGAAVFALLWPLGRGHRGAFADTGDAKSLYRAQMAEIDRDLARHLIGTGDAEAARAEAARRLLRSAETQAASTGETEFSLRRRRAASALALSFVPLLALLVYGAYGSPDQPDQPLSARLQVDQTQQEFALSLARIETHLAANPSDGKGWAVLAPVYLRQGRYDEAVQAFSAAIRHDGSSADKLAGLGEAQMMAAGGVVTAQARQSFAAAVASDRAHASARFYLAIASEQDGDVAAAASALRALLTDASPDAPWASDVRQRLGRLEAQADASRVIVALPPADQQAAIRAMVEGLAGRLTSGGGSLQDWTRLVRSQMVLGDRSAALAALATARMRLAQDQAALSELEALAGELGLRETAP